MKTFYITTHQEFNDSFAKLEKIITKPVVIGFDVEKICKANQPESFKKSHKWVLSTNSGIAACMIQIAYDDMCLLIDISKMTLPLPKKLLNIIVSDVWIKVGVGIEQDIKLLSENYKLGHCSGVIELKNFAQLAGCMNPNLGNIYRSLVGYTNKNNSKSICDWSKSLSASDLIYAAEDACMSLLVYKKIFNPIIESLNKEFSVGKINISLENFSYNTNVKQNSNNYISDLQEWCQSNKFELPIYNISENLDKTFNAVIKFQTFDGWKSFNACGKSKKIAKHNVAKKAFLTI